MFDEKTVRFICEKVLRDIVMDVFYLISKKGDKGISKIEILREYQSYVEPEYTGGRKYRYIIDEAIATLIGTTFIDYFQDGTSYKYFLTKNGEVAMDIMAIMVEQNGDLLKSSKIVSVVMEGNTQ